MHQINVGDAIATVARGSKVQPIKVLHWLGERSNGEGKGHTGTHIGNSAGGPRSSPHPAAQGIGGTCGMDENQLSVSELVGGGVVVGALAAFAITGLDGGQP
jgi:hypothetical protein